MFVWCDFSSYQDHHCILDSCLSLFLVHTVASFVAHTYLLEPDYTAKHRMRHHTVAMATTPLQLPCAQACVSVLTLPPVIIGSYLTVPLAVVCRGILLTVLPVPTYLPLWALLWAV